MPRFRAPRLRLSRSRPGGRTIRRNAVALLLTAAAATVAMGLQAQQIDATSGGGPLYALETSAQDLVLRNRDPERYGTGLVDPRQKITIVALDDASFDRLGIWRSWPRTYYAQAVDRLLVGQPRVIVFDVGFFDPTPEDGQLAAAFERARTARPRPTSVVIATAGNPPPARGPDGDLVYREGLQPVPVLAEHAEVAAANVIPDDRGSIRTMPLLFRLGTQPRPALGLAATARYLRRPGYVDGRPDPETILLAGRTIPVDRSGVVRINYFGPPSIPNSPTATFRALSFVDVLQGRADPETWRDGIVFVGMLNATGFADDYWTPVSVSGKMAGVEIHANVAATLFSTQFLNGASGATQLGIVAGLALVIGLLAANASVLVAAVGSLVVLGLYVAATLAGLDQVGLQLPLANPVLGGSLAFIAVTAYRVVVEQRQARALQGALASVIPPSVAHEIARDPDRVRMGGERRTITVLFTDLKGFTTFSEAVDPVLLSRVITEYLDAMTEVVFRYGGTVDKFIGDAVMAFWNAPLDDPDHAVHACQAALDMQAALRRLGDRWEAEGLPRQRMRIGIHTGPASVGNMGTSQRFAYTALGDTVNLGARLEPLNNEYGTWVCVSQATLDAAGGRDQFLVRFLDLVAVKGKTEPVPVYELIGRADDVALRQRYEPVLNPYHQAMLLYQGHRFAEAAELFQTAVRATGDDVDPPSAVYLERCEALAQEPPPSEWDGVYVMQHK